jgi:hypothetical protein
MELVEKVSENASAGFPSPERVAGDGSTGSARWLEHAARTAAALKQQNHKKSRKRIAGWMLEPVKGWVFILLRRAIHGS